MMKVCMTLAFTSQQKEAKEFRKYCFNCTDCFPKRDHFEQLAINVKDSCSPIRIEKKIGDIN